jgi:predicted ArsR family transcriptional regulator
MWIAKKLAKRFAPGYIHEVMTRGALCKAFYEKYGKEALPIIAKVAGEFGLEGVKIAQGMLRGKGMKAVGELYEIYEMMGMSIEITDLTDDMIHLKVSQCPFGLEGTAKELCEAAMTGDKKTVSALLGQEVEMKIPQSVAAGNEYCEVIFTRSKVVAR